MLDPALRTHRTTTLQTERVETVRASEGLHDVSIRGIILLFSSRTVILPITRTSGSVVEEEGISRLRTHQRTKEKI